MTTKVVRRKFVKKKTDSNDQTSVTKTETITIFHIKDGIVGIPNRHNINNKQQPN